MSELVEGKWVEKSFITSDDSGRYDRIPRSFRDVISTDHPTFKPETDRYHLYVSYACPWATRTLIYRSLKDLEKHIGVSVVHPDMLSNSWTFDTNFTAATGDDLYGLTYLYELYQKAQHDVTTSVTVPVLWDKKTHQIVNNESSEIIRIFNTNFNSLTGNTEDYYPEALRAERRYKISQARFGHQTGNDRKFGSGVDCGTNSLESTVEFSSVCRGDKSGCNQFHCFQCAVGQTIPKPGQ